MKLSITTLVIIEDIQDKQNDMSIFYHSFEENPKAANDDIIQQVNQVYYPSCEFHTIQEIIEYFDYAHIEKHTIVFSSSIS